MADKLFPVVPDTGTLKAARLATEVTGNPGRWVRLDCPHRRHVQRPVEPGQLLECPTCPPSVTGGLPAHRVLSQGPERRPRPGLDDAGRREALANAAVRSRGTPAPSSARASRS